MNQDSFLFRGEVEDSKKTATKRSFKEVKKAFRDAFGKLGSLRSLMPSVPLLALTATANKVTERKIVKSLGIRNFTMLRVSPNRLNIRLSKMKVAKLTPSILNWVVDGLRQEKEKYNKTIIYCQSIEAVSKVFTFLREELGQCAYDSTKEEQSVNSLLIGMYHRKTLTKHKERVLGDLSTVNGSCRVVVATTSLVMGVDINDLRSVIHFGAPLDVEDYIQGIGRAGRDRLPATAILYFSGHQIAKVSQEMKSYAKSDATCLRKELYENFAKSGVKRPDKMHDCCSFCHQSCNCQGSECAVTKPGYEKEQELEAQLAVRTVSEGDCHLLVEILSDYKVRLERQYQHHVSFADKQFLTGISSQTIEEVAKQAPYISTMEYILENTPLFLIAHAGEILLIIHDIFNDIEDGEILKASEAVAKYSSNVECEGEAVLQIPEYYSDLNSEEDINLSELDVELDDYFEDFETINFSDNDE